MDATTDEYPDVIALTGLNAGYPQQVFDVFYYDCSPPNDQWLHSPNLVFQEPLPGRILAFLPRSKVTTGINVYLAMALNELCVQRGKGRFWAVPIAGRNVAPPLVYELYEWSEEERTDWQQRTGEAKCKVPDISLAEMELETKLSGVGIHCEGSWLADTHYWKEKKEANERLGLWLILKGDEGAWAVEGLEWLLANNKPPAESRPPMNAGYILNLGRLSHRDKIQSWQSLLEKITSISEGTAPRKGGAWLTYREIMEMIGIVKVPDLPPIEPTGPKVHYTRQQLEALRDSPLVEKNVDMIKAPTQEAQDIIDLVDDAESRLTQLKIDRVVTRAQRADSDPFGPITAPTQVITPHSASDLNKYSVPPMPLESMHRSVPAATTFQPSMPWNIGLVQQPGPVMPGHGGWGWQPGPTVTADSEWRSTPGYELPVDEASMRDSQLTMPYGGQFYQHTTTARGGHTGRPSRSGSSNHHDHGQGGDGRFDG
ncbi:hypothetical protein LTS18_006777 [Coniosporium uncinatum]|uniref:Uncharacterized protein n=1 Tax=Coniosporium uncinatum TaxID=93489 RepID=A0ACC3DY35_9PEZI|nr:hypothetical protein LTS18_006777 [Coniosporium uncinatum]